MKKLKLYGLINSSVQGNKHTTRHQYISFLIYDSCHSCYPFFILFFSISLPPSLLLFISFPPCLLHLPAIITASSQLHFCCLLLPFVSPPPTVTYYHISLSASSLIFSSFSSFSSSSLTSSPRSPPLTS